MIWRDGQIGADGSLDLPRADRLFEHGLGLFETFRTWHGRAVLLDRHLARLRHSASALGIDLAGAALPTADDVAQLLATTARPDALVRLTVSAGRPPDLAPAAWMTAAPLPPSPPAEGWRAVAAAWTVAPGDPHARHKTLNYWSKRLAHEQARADGADESIFSSSDGRIWEGSRTNLFVIRRQALLTPPRSGPIIPGIMRGLALELAGRANLEPAEADLSDATIAGADEVFLTNSVRGLIPLAEWQGREYRPNGAGFPRTARLRQTILDHLTREATRP